MSDGSLPIGRGRAAPKIRAAEVWPVFLPVVGVQDAATFYQEALVRTGLSCGHQRLLAMAESQGFVAEIDCAVLVQSIDVLRRTTRTDVGVNVSAGTLKCGVERWIEQLSGAADVSARLIVELTETQVFDDLKKLASFVDACRHFGVRIALDDYESGQFDDALVDAVSPDIIKLANIWDGGYVGAQSRVAKHLERVSKLGQFEVVAEQVDAKWKMDMLSEFPITHAQGLFVGRHLSVRELIDSCGREELSFSVASEPLFAAFR